MEPVLSWTFTYEGKVTKVYRKEFHTNRYLNCRSNHSKSLLVGIIKGQTHRAHYVCDLKEDLLEELCFLRDVFVVNSYPLNNLGALNYQCDEPKANNEP